MARISKRHATHVLTSHFCSREDQEWFSVEFKVWWDIRDPSFMLDLSLPISTELPLPADILMDYTLEFKIPVEQALTDFRECLREAV